MSSQQLKVQPDIAQINAKSDKVIYERFDQEFSKACKHIGILSDKAKDEDI